MEPVPEIEGADGDEPDSISIAIDGFHAEIVIASCAATRWREIFDSAMQSRVKSVLATTLDRAGSGGKTEAAILLTDDGDMARLNAAYGGKNTPTNVLAFSEDDNDMLGNIALSLGVITREADSSGIPVSDHVLHLVVHGMLHLLGHSHDDDATAQRMESLEVEILTAHGIANPYGEQS